MVITFILAAVVGIAIGVLSGLLGVGGGVIMVPVFRLVFGMSALSSTATSLFTIIPTSISGAASHFRQKTCVVKLGAALGIGGACTSWLGVWLAQISPEWLVMVAAAAVIGYSAYTMLRKAIKAPKRARQHTGGQSGQSAQGAQGESKPAPSQATATQTAFEPPAFSTSDLAKAVAIGATAGVASGYIGLGGGFLMVPLMVSLLNMPMRYASGTSLVAVMMLALPATIMQCAIGNVDYVTGIAVACGSIPGAMLGARLANRVPERALRFTFAAFLGVAAILLVLKETGALGA